MPQQNQCWRREPKAREAKAEVKALHLSMCNSKRRSSKLKFNPQGPPSELRFFVPVTCNLKPCGEDVSLPSSFLTNLRRHEAYIYVQPFRTNMCRCGLRNKKNCGSEDVNQALALSTRRHCDLPRARRDQSMLSESTNATQLFLPGATLEPHLVS